MPKTVQIGKDAKIRRFSVPQAKVACVLNAGARSWPLKRFSEKSSSLCCGIFPKNPAPSKHAPL